MSDTEVASPSESEVVHVGKCKWFNNKAGYGFITGVDKISGTEQDIFVHHSALRVSEEQYKYLIQGEYVEFIMKKTEGGDHEWQADQVSGISGGKLMCETRREVRGYRNEMRGSMDVDDTNEREWTEVKNDYTKRGGKGGRGGRGGKGKGGKGVRMS
tara:strand:+ start:20 stop:490 length:471 start_codon:yes stop_codon:yes gene_type:complete